MLRFLFLVVLFAVAVYLLVRVFQERGPGAGAGGHRPRRPHRPARPTIIAPDDDEEFLRELDRKRRHPEDPDS
ncbi:hypothetical protein [Nocardioides sp. GXZ039]|uniref:hypothetical protein n=1 Tax=Nocardioides sp. GXZ039 TaxID=3136018 RepID=UPI0030F3BEA2